MKASVFHDFIFEYLFLRSVVYLTGVYSNSGNNKLTVKSVCMNAIATLYLCLTHIFLVIHYVILFMCLFKTVSQNFEGK